MSENKTFDLEAVINKCSLGETSKNKPKWVLETDKGKFHITHDHCPERPIEGKRYMLRGSVLLVGEKKNEMKWAEEAIQCSDEELGPIPGLPGTKEAPPEPPKEKRPLTRDESYLLHTSLGAALNNAYSQIQPGTSWDSIENKVKELYPKIFALNQEIHKKEEERFMAGF